MSVLDENISKKDDVLRVKSARIILKINVKKTKSLRLGIKKVEEVIFGKR